MKIKEYYQLKELSQISTSILKYRQLQKRIKTISEKYVNRKELLYKKSNRWYIHNSIVTEFVKSKNLINYKLFITISSKNRYDFDCWKRIMYDLNKEIKKIDASTRVKFVIETTKLGILHLHFITTFDKINKLKKIISMNEMTNKSNEMDTYIEKIDNLKQLHKYLHKENRPILIKNISKIVNSIILV